MRYIFTVRQKLCQSAIRAIHSKNMLPLHFLNSFGGTFAPLTPWAGEETSLARFSSWELKNYTEICTGDRTLHQLRHTIQPWWPQNRYQRVGQRYTDQTLAALKTVNINSLPRQSEWLCGLNYPPEEHQWKRPHLYSGVKFVRLSFRRQKEGISTKHQNIRKPSHATCVRAGLQQPMREISTKQGST